MRKKLLIISIMIISTLSFAQIGVSTATPLATMDVTAKAATGSTTTVDGILIPRVDRQRAQSMTGVTTSTLIYINDISTGTQTGITANVDTVGFYFYNGTLWAKLNPIDTSTNSFIPRIVASASYGSGAATLVQAGSPIAIAPTSVVNSNDGNYNVGTDKYTVPVAGTYNLSFTLGYQLVNNSANNAMTIFAVRENAAGTILSRIILNSVSNYSYNGGVSPTVYVAGSAILRTNVGDRVYFQYQVCASCGGGRYDIYEVETTYQQVSN
jgi:hypothetical protein